jgi:hypothetical protein
MPIIFIVTIFYFLIKNITEKRTFLRYLSCTSISISQEVWLPDYLIGIIILEILAVLFYFLYIRGKSKEQLLKNKVLAFLYNLFLDNKLIRYSKNTKFYRATIEGFMFPTMNSKVLSFHNLLFIRIFRVIGGISILILAFVSLVNIKLPNTLTTILFAISVLFASYTFGILCHSIFYITRAIIKGDTLYKNSPVATGASIYKTSIICLKGVCKLGGFVSVGLGIGMGFDYYTKSNFTRDLIYNHLSKPVMDKYGLDFTKNYKPLSLYYNTLNLVPKDIMNMVDKDISGMTDIIYINKEEIWTNSEEGKLFLTNLAHADINKYKEFVEYNSAELVKEKQDLFKEAFNAAKAKEAAKSKYSSMLEQLTRVKKD